MQLIRNVVWRFIALIFLALFTVSFSPSLIGGEVAGAQVTQQTIIGAYIAFACGIVMPLRFLKIPATLTHEVGHALASSLLGGKVKFIRVEIDESGLTWSESKRGRFGQFFVCAAGPLANAVFFLFTVNLIVHNASLYWIGFTLLSVVLITISTVRSFWGWITAIFISVVLSQALIRSLQFTSATDTYSNIGIWTQSSINLAVIFTAYTAAIELRYAWNVRRIFSENQDEFKVSQALGISPRIGGRLLFLVNLILVLAAFSQALGWDSLWTPGKFL